MYIELKHLSWILATLVFLGVFFYQAFKEGRAYDFAPFLIVIANLVGYLVFWLIWLIIY